MGEIKTPLEVVGKDIDGDPIFVITADNSIADVIRWCIEQGEDKLTLIQMILEA